VVDGATVAFMRGKKQARWALAMVAACLAVVLSACSDNSPPDDDTRTTPATSTASSAPPTTVPTPTLPASAKADKAGAEAFVRYFWDVFNYTYASGDTKLLRSISDKTCKFCASVQDYVERLNEQGYKARGSSMVVKTAVAPPADAADGLLVYTVVSQAAGEVVASDGTVKESSEAHPNLRSDTLVRWSADEWHVLGVSFGGPGATP
jgi:hypothetical protein